MSTLKESTNLDFLRAVAVLSVLADHMLEMQGKLGGFDFHPWDWYLGRIGVLIFFVHTSLVLMRSMARLHLTDTSSLCGAFYLQRAFRIYPLSIFCVLAAVALHIPDLPWVAFRWRGFGNLIANLTLTQNLTYSESVLAPLWSLPLELQMYVVLPIIFLLLRRGNTKLTLIGLIIASIGLAKIQPLISGRLDVAQFGPCFLGGCLAYTIERKPTLPSWAWPVTLAALIAGYIALEQIDPTSMHPPALAWLLCLTLGAVIPQFSEISNGFLTRACHLIAKYSYGVYLFHVMLLYVAFEWLTAPIPLQWGLFLALIIVVPVAAYHLLEHPMIQLGRRVVRIIYKPTSTQNTKPALEKSLPYTR